VSLTLGLSPRAVRNLLASWVNEGWLDIANPSRKLRRYRLSAVYRQFIGKITAEAFTIHNS